MGNESQTWINSVKSLNASNEVEEIEIEVQPQPACTAIFIPETGELVLLTATEYIKLVDDADEFDEHSKSVALAIKSENQQSIASAKEAQLKFIDEKLKNNKSSTTPTGIKSLTKIIDSPFVEIIEIGAKKHSFLLRTIIDSFRHPDKVLKITQPAFTSDNRNSDIQSLSTMKAEKTTKRMDKMESLPPLRTEGGKINMERIKEQFLKDFKGKLNYKIVKPDAGQLPSKYLTRILPFGWTYEDSEVLKPYFDQMDAWVKEVNGNLNTTMQDSAVRRKQIIEWLDPTATPGNANSELLLDDSPMQQLKKEVDYIYSSDDPNKKKYVEDYYMSIVKPARRQTWNQVSHSLSGLESFYKFWIQKISQNAPPEEDRRKQHHQDLVQYLKKKQSELKKEAKTKADKSAEESVFDDYTLGRVKAETKYIWGNSDIEKHITLVSLVSSLEWDSFAPDDETLLNNRNDLLEKVKENKIPPYTFDASASAQLMRYSYGVTSTGYYDFSKGQFAINAKARTQIALVEAKVGGKMLLPTNEGVNISLKHTPDDDTPVWEEIDNYFPDADTFEVNESFLLPGAIEKLKSGVLEWKMRNQIGDNQKVQIIGHADAPGTPDYNDQLSKKRAQVGYEYLTYNVNAWNKRFESGEWGDREIRIMFNGLGYSKTIKGELTDDNWIDIITKYQEKKKGNPTPAPVYLGVPQTCTVENAYNPFNGTHAINGRVGTKMADGGSGRVTLLLLIQDYMQMAQNNEFLLAEHFQTPAYLGKGETDLKVKTNQHTYNDFNRRLSFHLIGSRTRKEDEQSGASEMIPLGYVRLIVDLYLDGYVGANAVAAAELVFGTNAGDLTTHGVQEVGMAQSYDLQNMHATQEKQDALNKAKTQAEKDKINQQYEDELNIKGPAKGEISAFAGAEATAGVKATLQWKCPEPESEIKEPNIVVPHIKCPDSKKKVIELQEGRDIQQGFVSLAAAGFAGTGSAGIGITGNVQIGFDATRKMFVIKAKAKATLGLGAGGAMEFAVSTENIWWFIRFVHAQLNDHNFSFLSFIDRDVYDRFSAWSWDLLRKGRLIEAGIVRLGTEGMRSLSAIDDLLESWDDYNQAEEEADELAKLVNEGQMLLQYMNPEVKGRLLDKLCHSNKLNLFDNDDNKEQAILRVLNTIASQREYQEIKERMGPFDNKSANLIEAEEKLTTVLKNQYLSQFTAWEKSLPSIAPRIIV